MLRYLFMPRYGFYPLLLIRGKNIPTLPKGDRGSKTHVFTPYGGADFPARHREDFAPARIWRLATALVSHRRFCIFTRKPYGSTLLRRAPGSRLWRRTPKDRRAACDSPEILTRTSRPDLLDAHPD